LVLIDGSQPLTREVLDYVTFVAVRAIRETDFTSGRYHKLAREMRYVGLSVLADRTSEIENHVRRALDDEEFSAEDFLVLKSFPEQLAKVERLAQTLRRHEPTWKSEEPPQRFPVLDAEDTSLFNKFASDAAREARTATSRMAGLISSQQIVLTQRQAQETTRFQRVVTIVGAAVLVPGLVAAIFGANVGFHGRDSASAFWAMLLFMTGSAIVTYALVRSLERNMWEGLAKKKLARSFARIPIATRLIFTAVFGAALLVVAAVVLLGAGSTRISPAVVQPHTPIQTHRHRNGDPAGPISPPSSVEKHRSTKP
jgi:CorA-like Mg2+ transporter protein